MIKLPYRQAPSAITWDKGQLLSPVVVESAVSGPSGPDGSWKRADAWMWGEDAEADDDDVIFWLSFPAPPSVNRFWRAFGGRVILSEVGRAWKKAALAAYSEKIDQNFLPWGEPPYAVSLTFRPDSRRAQDVDNRVKPTLDMLQALNIIANDSEITDLRVKKVKPVQGLPARMTVTIKCLPQEGLNNG